MRAYSRPQKHSLTLAKHRTSVSLEDPFWEEFCKIARREGMTINALASSIDNRRKTDIGLASAIRLYVLSSLQKRLADKE